MNLSDIKLKLEISDRLENLNRRIRKNEIISGYYESLLDEVCEYWDDEYWGWSNEYLEFMDAFRLHCRSSISRVLSCSRYFKVEYYPLQGVKDLVNTKVCCNKFCDNCQNTLSVKRFKRYSPVFDELSRCFEIGHAVFTVPNCKPEDLKKVIENMYDCFGYMIRYLSGKKKIRHIDFNGYGFEGGIRALEITKNDKEGTFHPHLHCIFIFRKGIHLSLNRKHLNKFSFDNEHYKPHHGDKVRYFTDFEILLQKIWYLRINHIEVTRDSISNLKQGYSVICETVTEGKYKEVFKYATKGVIKHTEQMDILQNSYRDFAELCFALYKKRIIQGFGCLWGCDFSDSIDLSEKNDLKYQKVVQKLRELETPIEMMETLKQINKNKEDEKHITYISRSNIGDLMEEDYETT